MEQMKNKNFFSQILFGFDDGERTKKNKLISCVRCAIHNTSKHNFLQLHTVYRLKLDSGTSKCLLFSDEMKTMYSVRYGMSERTSNGWESDTKYNTLTHAQHTHTA